MTELMPELIVTGEQIRAARAMLRIDQKQFASLTHVTMAVMRRMERTRGPIVAAPGLLEAMRLALEDAGIELIPAGPYQGIGGPGLRMKGEPVVAEDVISFQEAVAEVNQGQMPIPDAS